MRKKIAAITALLFIGGALLVLTPAAFCAEPAVGTKIGPDNWKQYEQYITQSLSAQIEKGGISFEVAGDATKFLQPSSGYKKATEQNKGKATLDANGVMSGWEAGRPFSDIDPKDPMAGFKIAYNLERRYEGDDQSLQAYQLINVDSKGQERYVTGTDYSWMWLSVKGRVDIEPLGEWAPNPKQIWRYNTLAIDFPYDIKGTSRLLIRYLDPAKDDDIWMYIPTMRRIRRMSGAQRQNNFVGTVCTYDDIRTFQGRPMEYDWKLIGDQKVLCAAMDGKTPHPKNEKGFWLEPRALRDCWIVEAIPRDKNYVYTKRLFWIDKECFVPWHETVFDVQGRTWKVCENFNAPIFMGEKADGELVIIEQSFIWLDLLDNTHTLLEYVGWDKDGKQTGKISTGQTREWYTIENIAKRGRRN